MKPILFNTEMVKAILDGRKTVTRRVVKPQPRNTVDKIALERFHAPYQIEDILYVRETRCQTAKNIFWYRADSKVQNLLWRPSIHMPKEAARIFLRVKDVHVERLKDIKDGWRFAEEGIVYEHGFRSEAWRDFQILWDSTVKPADRDKYGWDANPWVWVIEFERISKSEAIKESK